MSNAQATRSSRIVVASGAATLLLIFLIPGSLVRAEEDEPPTVEYVVPAASSHGVGGSNWQANLNAYNPIRPEDPSNQTATIFVEAIRNGTTETVASKEFHLEPGHSMTLPDLARLELGLGRFSGMFRITAPEDIILNTRTENYVDSAVVGLSVPPQPAGAIPANTQAVTMLYPDVENYRVNEWYTTKEDNSLEVLVRSLDRAYHDDGVIARRTINLAAGQTIQYSDTMMPFFEDEDGNIRTDIADGERPVALLVTGTEPFNMGVSIIDNRGAQDPTWYSPAVDMKRIVDTVGVDSTGANNSHWKTSMTIWSPWPERHRLDYWFFPEDGGVFTAFSSVDALSGMHYEDVFEELFRPQNPDFPTGNVQGKLEASLCNQGAYAKVRVSNQNEDGSTSGQGMDLMHRGESTSGLWESVLFGLANNDDTRTNVGVLEANGQLETVFRLTVVDGDTGEQVWTKTYLFQPNQWDQFNGLLDRNINGRPMYEGDNAIVYVQPLIGTLHAYATEIMNEPALPDEEKHNDPSFRPATVIYPPFQPLDMVVIADKSEADVNETVHYRLWARNGHQYTPSIKRITGDINNDGDFDDPGEFDWDIGRYERFVYEEFDIKFGEEFRGQTITPRFTVTGKYNDYGVIDLLEDYTTTVPITIKPGGTVPTAEQYVGKWFPPMEGRFYLSNDEIRNMINGGQGTPSHAREMAEILFNHSDPQPPFDVDFWEQALNDYADGSTENDELYSGFDPMAYTWGVGVRFYEKPDGTNVTDFNMDEEGMNFFWNLSRDYMVNRVDANEHLYSCDGSTTLDWYCDPTWATQDPN